MQIDLKPQIINDFMEQLEWCEINSSYKLPPSNFVLLALDIYSKVQSENTVNCHITITNEGNIILEWHSKDWANKLPADRVSIALLITKPEYKWWQIRPKVDRPILHITKVDKDDFWQNDIALDDAIKMLRDWLNLSDFKE